MPWTRLLESAERQPAARLEDWYASLLAACPEAAQEADKRCSQ